MKSDSYEYDLFISHRSTNEDTEFAKRLAGDIESEIYQGPPLKVFLDKWDIRTGSLPGSINKAISKSRFWGFVLTPAYFSSDSGWTDAESDSIISLDPNNRQGRIIPLLFKNCILPPLISQYPYIDFRNNYENGLQKLLYILKKQPFPRGTKQSRKLVSIPGPVERRFLPDKGFISDVEPDQIEELLQCNLLPFKQLPDVVYRAFVFQKYARYQKDEIKNVIRDAHKGIPAFRLHKKKIITFHNLHASDVPLGLVVDHDYIEEKPTKELLQNVSDRNIVTSLLNMEIDRFLYRLGLIKDETKPDKHRFYFPPKNGTVNIIWWKAFQKRASRKVAKPCKKDGEVMFWRHAAANIKAMYLQGKYYLHIEPTWVFTEDGSTIITGALAGKLAIRWAGPERNLGILYHIRFWTSIMRGKSGTIVIKTGDQNVKISTRPAFVRLSFGIADDQKKPMASLDEEAEIITKDEKTMEDLIVGSEADFEDSESSEETIEEEYEEV
ncbi:hypothetical protein CEE36_03435 [candidate division TA06 bacterium B3_TA06]|uniref:TIR domain-containing protein n=1 Tax=candidate division TA06 bacterium B3_TA06 TaxID=2012487 RepID=A0A532V9D1_UNCT6|nr:MAG: hypothetical protein CEE36_03435 [candidate division TA06 bacterium B3_TA06]